MRRLSLVLLLVACKYNGDSDESDEPTTPICDGRQQAEESEIDAPFDQDGDGFFDASNPDCAAAWLPNQLDCDDSNPEVNPSAFEIPCNGIDEDCRDASPDNADNDGDGVGVCDDCDDQRANVNPNQPETCWDGLDNDCDGIQDNDCGEDYNGVWSITPNDINHNCSFAGQPLVNLDFNELNVVWFPPNMTVSSATSSQPSAMDGTVDPSSGVYHLEATVGGPGSCVETYTMDGTFTSADTMQGTFTYRFQGICLGCAVPLTSVDFTALKQ
ncbi:MAG: putative metal-binding motif-containing protein [Alphaproteobacteria bacterium]|nr:putative metal-binding motif-containing protein [Alphaproteobacteria bacterium]